MENDFRKEARRQYFRYFGVWFLAVGILAAVCVGMGVVKRGQGGAVRTNPQAPAERVYDYADVLTEEEEESLRRQIAEAEGRLSMDIVLVTISQSVEGSEAKEQYGYRSANWEQNMRDLADDFWDENQYGFNKGFEGDGVLLLHNWYPGQNGEHLSTSGKAERAFSSYDIDRVLDAVDVYYASDPYRAYQAYVDKVCGLMTASSAGFRIPWVVVFILPLAVAGVYAEVNLSQKKAKDTTTVNTYVAGGKPVLNGRADDFVRKSVVTRKIEGSGGTGHSSGTGRSGGGGHHHSSSGASHGGGSHRH